jgi:ABC-type polysaccharide/polyol phosphate transport system ATPase subunit
MDFVMEQNRTKSLKEYIIQGIKREHKRELFHVLKDINFKVEKGEVMGIVGRNGAGKSTLLKVISGIFQPKEGDVVVNGTIAPMLELGSGMDSELTGRENIYLNGSILGFKKDYLESKFDEIVDFSELSSFIDMPIRNYSSGMMMRLAFSIATIVVPDVLIVDEILSVGDDHFQRKSKQRMLELMKGGTTVLFVSHSLGQIKELCNRVLWLDNGSVRMLGSCAEVCDEYEKALE